MLLFFSLIPFGINSILCLCYTAVFYWFFLLKGLGYFMFSVWPGIVKLYYCIGLYFWFYYLRLEILLVVFLHCIYPYNLLLFFYTPLFGIILWCITRTFFCGGLLIYLNYMVAQYCAISIIIRQFFLIFAAFPIYFLFLFLVFLYVL